MEENFQSTVFLYVVSHRSAPHKCRFFKVLYLMLTLIASFKVYMCTCKNWEWKKSGEGAPYVNHILKILKKFLGYAVD